MTPTERVAVLLAERFAAIDAASIVIHPAFVHATLAALDVLEPHAVVARVVEMGSLAGARDPHKVIVHRLRSVPALVARSARLADERAEERRWAAVDDAAKRGETLRALVDAGQIFRDEAREMLDREMIEEDLRAIAAAALDGDGS